MKRPALLLIATVLAVGPSACGGSGVTTVDVSTTEFAFDPAPIVLDADGNLHVTNDGGAPHDLTIPELGKGTPPIDPGEDATLHLKGQPTGTYRVICDLDDHLAKGMETVLTIR